MSEQLCWNCAKCFGGCSWSDEYKPIDGWTAKKIARSYGKNQEGNSYEVTNCPEYELEKPTDPQSIDFDGCINLLVAYAHTAAEDYKAAWRTYFSLRKAFDEENEKKMLENINHIGQCFPEHIVKQLEKEVRNDRKAMA